MARCGVAGRPRRVNALWHHRQPTVVIRDRDLRCVLHRCPKVLPGCKAHCESRIETVTPPFMILFFFLICILLCLVGFSGPHCPCANYTNFNDFKKNDVMKNCAAKVCVLVLCSCVCVCGRTRVRVYACACVRVYVPCCVHGCACVCVCVCARAHAPTPFFLPLSSLSLSLSLSLSPPTLFLALSLASPARLCL